MIKINSKSPLRMYRMQYRNLVVRSVLYMLLICVLLTILIWNHVTKQSISGGQAEIRVGQRSELVNIELNNISRCYRLPYRSSVRYFVDIMDHEHRPTTGKSIFFHETSCTKTGIAKLNSR